jgi:hypothetical protein
VQTDSGSGIPPRALSPVPLVVQLNLIVKLHAALRLGEGILIRLNERRGTLSPRKVSRSAANWWVVTSSKKCRRRALAVSVTTRDIHYPRTTCQFQSHPSEAVAPGPAALLGSALSPDLPKAELLVGLLPSSGTGLVW